MDLTVNNISQALNATLDAHCNNDTRREALTYLEQVKSQPDAPLHGFTLAQDEQQTQAVRYYGLQVLEYAVKYKWTTYDDAQTKQLRIWITSLASRITEKDAGFYRNKIGQLWVECAKRDWGVEWHNMDEELLELWQGHGYTKPNVKHTLVLYILETLAEDICNREDTAAGLRLDELGSLLNLITIPEELYRAHVEKANPESLVRSGREGWLARVCSFVSECLKQVCLSNDQGFSLCAAKGFNLLRTAVSWISLKAIIEVNCIDVIFQAFYTKHAEIRIAAAETLYTILSRPTNAHFQPLELECLNKVMQPENIALLATVFKDDDFMPAEDEEIYTLQKKTSELLSSIVDALLQQTTEPVRKDALDAVFQLLLRVLQNKSLMVSIPVLHSWTKLLSSKDQQLLEIVMQALGVLVEVCSQRLINYEMLSEDSNSPIIQYIYQDFETMPERHAFLGNYRRYCVNVIETIARQRPVDALNHVLGQMQLLLKSGPYTQVDGLDIHHYSKTAPSVLEFDAQFTVVMSVIKGIVAWETAVTTSADANTDQSRHAQVLSLQQWCLEIVELPIDDPEVSAHVLAILSSVIRNTRAHDGIVLRIVRYLIEKRFDHSTSTSYTDAVKGYEALRVLEAQKIAVMFADELFQYYQDLEHQVGLLISKSDDDRVVWGFKAFLLILVHRTTHLNDSTRLHRLRSMIEPVLSSWQDPGLKNAIATFESFCNALGLGQLSDFYSQHNFDKIEDWATQHLNLDGQARQSDIKARLEQLPLRMTKSFLGATTEKVKDGSSTCDVTFELWQSSVSTILPSLLQMIRYSQAFSNLATWSSLPPALQAVIRKTFQDRFWQSGISNESRDEFYARVNGSKSSYEGFASSVRGSLRTIREQGYHIIYLLTKFDEQFYSMADLPEALAGSLFEDADGLSTHHIQPLINLATGLVQRCPPQYQRRFLPPLLNKMFIKLDKKISSEWEEVVSIVQETAEDDDLSEEMRIESVLRQLTYSMVCFVAFLLDPGKQALGMVVLGDRTIIEPLLVFCTHALRMRDTRCCSTICKVLNQILPVFAKDTSYLPEVREFICSEVFKAGITSLNEPYFVDIQKDLAVLLALILMLYTSKSDTPRNILLSLPGLDASKIDQSIQKLCKARSARQQRALVLDLLEGVRGVSIHESGKLARQDMNRKLKVQAQYMEVEEKPSIINGNEVGLDGIGDLFGDI